MSDLRVAKCLPNISGKGVRHINTVCIKDLDNIKLTMGILDFRIKVITVLNLLLTLKVVKRDMKIIITSLYQDSSLDP
jgi:hypothetical protein